jgi:hypothetical protein
MNRVCSERRSATAYPQFVFYEEAKNPLLTFEVTAELSTTQARQLASAGGVFPHPMESTLINILLNPRQPRTRQVVLAGKSLVGVDLTTSKYRTSLQLSLQTIKEWFPKTWNRLWVNVSVCDDTNKDGLCYGEKTPYQLLTQATGFRLGRVPRNVNLFVWSNRSNTLRANPDRCEEQISPLVLDLTGSGFQFSSAEAGVVFDLKDTGEPVLSGWTLTREEAFLVRDLDGNGQIDSGAELFGSATPLENGERAANGFLALAELDSNSNGLFDPRDTHWGSVQLWIDSQRNGTSEGRELFSLERAGIESIGLQYVDATEVDPYGNETRQRSVYHRRVGGVSVAHQVIDIWFNTLSLD